MADLTFVRGVMVDVYRRRQIIGGGVIASLSKTTVRLQDGRIFLRSTGVAYASEEKPANKAYIRVRAEGVTPQQSDGRDEDHRRVLAKQAIRLHVEELSTQQMEELVCVMQNMIAVHMSTDL